MHSVREGKVSNMCLSIGVEGGDVYIRPLYTGIIASTVVCSTGIITISVSFPNRIACVSLVSLPNGSYSSTTYTPVFHQHL